MFLKAKAEQKRPHSTKTAVCKPADKCQREKNQHGRNSGSGTPGSAPINPRTFIASGYGRQHPSGPDQHPARGKCSDRPLSLTGSQRGTEGNDFSVVLCMAPAFRSPCTCRAFSRSCKGIMPRPFRTSVPGSRMGEQRHRPAACLLSPEAGLGRAQNEANHNLRRGVEPQPHAQPRLGVRKNGARSQRAGKSSGA